MRIELGEELLNRIKTGGEHKGLVAVIPATPIAIAEGAGHRHLRDFLPITEDPKLRLTRQHLAPPEHAGKPALVRDAVVF